MRLAKGALRPGAPIAKELIEPLKKRRVQAIEIGLIGRAAPGPVSRIFRGSVFAMADAQADKVEMLAAAGFQILAPERGRDGTIVKKSIASIAHREEGRAIIIGKRIRVLGMNANVAVAFRGGAIHETAL